MDPVTQNDPQAAADRVTGPVLDINGRFVGAGYPIYIIAEMSANHHHDFDKAVRIIKAAKDAGADAVKLQTYTADTMTIDSDRDYFRVQGTIWEGRTLHDLYQEAYTPWGWQPKLMDIANDLGLDLFSTPFDESSVDFLEEMDIPVYKVASFENGDIPLLRTIARTGKPVIMSTGMATFDEIGESVTALREHGADDVALLKCTSAYPSPTEEMHLRTIPHMADAFEVVVGLSDHTLDIAVPVGAAALGASIIEKHLTLSRAEAGPDSAFSLEPDEFHQMVSSVRAVEKALGSVQYGPTTGEQASRAFRRSLFAVTDIREGEMITHENVRSIRPGHGLHPRYLDEVIGRRASEDIGRGTPLNWDLIEES